MQTYCLRLPQPKKLTLAAYIAIVFSLAIGILACANHPAPPPTQAQAPAATEPSNQVASQRSTPAPLRANCGGKNQPPCGPPDCGTINNDCCTGNKCLGADLVCKSGTCVPKTGACGGLGDPCCVNKNPVCSNYLLKCIDKVCAPGMQVSNLSVTLRTNDEDKDDDTGVQIAIDNLSTWSQTSNTHYDDWSTHTWSLNPPVVRLDDLPGRYVSICMMPNGNDTWKFNFLLQGDRDDGLKYEIRKDNVFLSTDVPCISWDATPDPTPEGRITAVDGKCLTAVNGGAVGALAALNDCAGGAEQDWLLAPEVSAPLPEGARRGQIRHLAQCLGLRSGSTANGTLLELQNCDSSPGQQWKWFGITATAITGPSTLCLDPNGQGEVVVSSGGVLSSSVGVIGGTSQRVLQYANCNGTPAQGWTLPVCGAANQACCNSGMPCQGNLSCKKATCMTDPPNINFLRAMLDTTNEDKDNDTQVSIAGSFSWPGDGSTHYDDWSTHLAPLTPSSASVASLPIQNLFLSAHPNGDDSWKLNFILDGVRDDGTYYEFRKDNVWLTNEGDSATQINWNLGPPPLDLVWKDTDANGLPLNPTWRGSPGGKSCGEGTEAACWDAFKVCPYHPTPLESNNWCIPLTDVCTGATPDDYGRCSSQAPTYDRSSYCGWHANWFPVAFDGTADSADFSTFPKDGDWHVDFRPRDTESNIGRVQLLAEFDSDETTENFISDFWNHEVDLSTVVNHNTARVIGLMGIDTEHGPPGGHAELHPTYAFQIRLTGSTTLNDSWAIFVRNFGNEGACGASQHYLDLQQFTLRFPAPHGAEGATRVDELVSNFDAGSENDSNWSNFTVSRVSPVQRDENGTYVEMTFTIGPPEDHTFIDGSVSLSWMCGVFSCPNLPPPSTANPPATSQFEDDDVVPGANLLTKDQLSQIQKQVPSRRLMASRTSRPIQVVPFTASTAKVFKVGQGSLTDRTVADTARQQRMVDVQKSICAMLVNDPKKPGICGSLPKN